MGDKAFTTLNPQDTDSAYDAHARAGRSIADVRGLLCGGITAPVGSGRGASATGQIMAANASRKTFFVQNCGTSVLTVEFGGAAVDLRPASALYAGDGAIWRDGLWKGAVSVTGTSIKYNWSER